MIVEPAEVISSSPDWVVLQISKSCWVVLPRAELVAGLKRGRAWRRHIALRERLEGLEATDLSQ
jgi:hypothetical protein